MVEQAIKKADVLIEALPYISKYQNKIVVIKYGGSAMRDDKVTIDICEDIAFLNYVGILPVVVHGGGALITQKMEAAGRKAKFINGLRVTEGEDLAIVDEALTEVNSILTGCIEKFNRRTKGLHGRRGILVAKKHESDGDLGYIGDIVATNVGRVKRSLNKRFIPVVSPMGKGRGGQLYNINADEASAELAIGLKAEKLVLLTDVDGIMREKGKPETLIPTLKVDEAEVLIKDETIKGGMIPKVKACTKVIKGGVTKAHIINGNLPHALLLEIFTDKGVGTEIVK